MMALLIGVVKGRNVLLYIACLATRELMWLKQVSESIEIVISKITLFLDNQSVIKLTHNLHIDLYGFKLQRGVWPWATIISHRCRSLI